MKRALSIATIMFALALPASGHAASLDAAGKASLQAAMFQHIDRQMVRGSFLHVNFKDGQVEKLAPAKAHPMMLTMGDNFVLCTTFRRASGADVNVDFYAAKTEHGYSIFHTVIDNRGPLMALVKAGKVKPIK